MSASAIPRPIWTPPEATGGTPGRGRLAGRRILVVGAGTQPCDDADAPLGNGRAISDPVRARGRSGRLRGSRRSAAQRYRAAHRERG